MNEVIFSLAVKYFNIVKYELIFCLQFRAFAIQPTTWNLSEGVKRHPYLKDDLSKAICCGPLAGSRHVWNKLANPIADKNKNT